MAGTLEVGTIKKGSASANVDDVINGCAKAWVNFNGTGTVAINASYNVSSVTDVGVGVYTVNFTNPLSDANYAVSSNCQYNTSNTTQNVYTSLYCGSPSPMQTTSVKLVSNSGSSNGVYDVERFLVTVFR